MFTLGNRLSNDEQVYISTNDFRQHAYIIGQTGSGKTTLLENLINQHLESGRGFCYIDKHGDSARKIADAAKVPVIYWKPADLSHTIALNPLQNVPEEERWKVTADIVSVFSDIWNLGTETPRLLYYLRASVRLLLDTPGTTLVDIRKVLSDGSYRAELVTKCSDTETAQTWEEFDAKDIRQQTTEISSLQNKVAALAAPIPLQRILGQPTSTINIRRLMDTGVPLILDLSEMGDEPAHLLGALVISQFALAAESRSRDMQESERPDYTLFVDEFQNFCSRTAPTILSEARKRRLALVIAHQYVAQLDPDIRDGIFGNVGSIVSFRIGAQDAPIVAKATGAPETELIDLPRGQAWARIAVDGQPHRALPIKTTVAQLATGNLESARRNTRASYSRAHVERPRPVSKPHRRAGRAARDSW